MPNLLGNTFKHAKRGRARNSSCVSLSPALNWYPVAVRSPYPADIMTLHAVAESKPQAVGRIHSRTRTNRSPAARNTQMPHSGATITMATILTNIVCITTASAATIDHLALAESDNRLLYIAAVPAPALLWVLWCALNTDFLGPSQTRMHSRFSHETRPGTSASQLLSSSRSSSSPHRRPLLAPVATSAAELVVLEDVAM